MSQALSGQPVDSGNPAHTILERRAYEPPSESPDSIRLLEPVWTSSGLTLQGGCRLYVGDHWRSGKVVATGLTDQGEGFAVVKTAKGTARCTDRRNLQTTEEARLFKNHQARWKNQRKAARRRLEEGRSNG